MRRAPRSHFPIPPPAGITRPAAAVIPALIAYFKVVAVKTLVVGF